MKIFLEKYDIAPDEVKTEWQSFLTEKGVIMKTAIYKYISILLCTIIHHNEGFGAEVNCRYKKGEWMAEEAVSTWIS